MSLVVGVRFADAGKLHYFDPGDLELAQGDCVLVETARGLEFGEIVLGPREVEDTDMTRSLKKVSKRADDRDYRKLEQNVRREEEAFRIGEEKIRKRHLPMKLIDVEYTFDGSKLIFYFAAEGRVDFRELVKDLASIFRTRIELRQIGVRDEAKKIGGLGPCGRPACCNAFLDDFAPVSIKMAKDQNLSLSPTKISGLCGRLMCCLHYEHEHYRDTLRKLPRIGTVVETPDGAAEVIGTDPLGARIEGRITLEDGTTEVRKYGLEDLGENLKRLPVRRDRGEDEPQAASSPAHVPVERQSSGQEKRRVRTKARTQRDGHELAEKKPQHSQKPRHERHQKPSHRAHADGQQRTAERHRRQRRPAQSRVDRPGSPQS